MKRLFLIVALTSLGAIHATVANATGATTRVTVPGVSVERSSHHSAIEVSTPVGRASMQSQYNNGRSSFDRAYDQSITTLRSGGGVANTGTQRETTTTSISPGVSVAGYGVDRTARTSTSTRSAEEAALHMWNRTQHLRDLQSSTNNRRLP